MKQFPLLVATGTMLAGCSTPTSTPEDEPRDDAHPNGAVVRWAQRRDADGTVPDNALVRMKTQRDAMMVAQGDSNSILHNWKWLGPGNVGGRIRTICIHPTKPATMWIGSVSGGIWKTTNGGQSWSALDDFAPVMTVGCMALDPKNPDRLYAGTGEGFFNTVPGSSILAASRGAGVFVTTNGGKTWTQMPSTKGKDFYFVNRIAISPKDSKVLLVATAAGIFRSTDAGTTFSKRTADFAMDIDFHPTDDKLAVAGTRDGFPRYSTDGGLTWTTATGIGQRQRVEVTYAPSNPNIVYAAVSQSDRITIYVSTNGGRSYARRTSGSGLGTYSRYNNTIWIDPSDANTMLVGGVRMWKSTDGGVSFRSAFSGSYYDYHAIVSHPSYNGTTNRIVFHGNDGGIYRTTDVKAFSVRWQELNNNLGITQFYGAAMSPNGNVVGGTQDNGTLRYTGNTEGWVRKIGADGCYCATDPTNSNYVYGQIYYIRIYRSTNGGQSFRQIATRSQIRDRGSNFIPHINLDPNDPNRMYFCGASLWRSDNIRASGPTWREVKRPLGCRDFTPTPTNPAHFGIDPLCNLSVSAVARGNANIVWAGHNHGDIYMTTNALAANPTWRKVDVNTQPNRWVGSIAIDPRDHKKVYASFLGYHGDNVWVTTNSGSSWAKITGTGARALPASPANWITVHPDLPGCLFVGTDVGLFYSTDDGTTWRTTSEGSNTSPIAELQWKNSRTLVVTTHGRGIYTVDIGETGFVRRVGQGCGAGSIPALSATVPTPGTTQTYSLTKAARSAPVTLLIAPDTRKIPIGNGCTLQVQPSVLLPTGATNAAGVWTYRLPIPLSKDLIGALATVQAAILRNGGPALGVADLSNGVEMRGGL